MFIFSFMLILSMSVLFVSMHIEAAERIKREAEEADEVRMLRE